MNALQAISPASRKAVAKQVGQMGQIADLESVAAPLCGNLDGAGSAVPMKAQLGDMHAASFAADPKHLGFVLARYKFVARMLTGKARVLEIGCGDATGARVVKPVVGKLTGIDRERYASESCIDVYHQDFVIDGLGGPCYDAIYALDVLEHVNSADEDRFLRHVTWSIDAHGLFIVGTPSKESQAYASEISRAHHVNCKTEDELRTTLGRHFRNVLMFGMNDETLHTGFGPMCQYRLAICAGPKDG